MTNDSFDPGRIAHTWWKALQPQTDKDDHVTHRGNPGALARLRRASSPLEALAEAEAIRLATKLEVTKNQPEKLAYIGALAATLAHVRTHRDRDDKGNRLSMAQMLGPDNKGENAVMPALRFQRLMAAGNPTGLMRQMRGAVKLLGGTANILDLAKAFYWWSHPERGDTTRINWTYDYWGAAEDKPGQTGKQTQETSK